MIRVATTADARRAPAAATVAIPRRRSAEKPSAVAPNVRIPTETTAAHVGAALTYRATVPPASAPSAHQIVRPVAQITHTIDGFLTGVSNWLSSLPATPISDFVSGTMLLDRRTLFPGVKVWVDTFANLYPWWSGSLLPRPLQRFIFHSTPVADPMQVQLSLPGGSTSRAIPFTASDPDGNALVYSVPAKGKPGGPEHGTVVVDNKTGTFTYTPDENFTGTDTFSFVASDATSPHLHAWDNLVNAAFGILKTSLAGGHRVTATVTVFNNVEIQPDPDVAAYTDIVGEFSVLTYNVAGLPFPLSGATLPRLTNTLEIGSRINAFDIVNVQEDVGYHPFLIANAAFPDQTPPSVPTWSWPAGVPVSDGLNSLSAYYIESLDRQSWTKRPTLLNPGGFTYSREHIPGGESVDVYNVDTSGGSLTNAEISQLSSFIQQNSIGRAVIVTGDFGQLYSQAGQTLTAFAGANGLTDAWVQLEYGGTTPTDAATCAYDNACEQPDKIFYRNAAPLDPFNPTSNPITLQALSYSNEGLNFLNGDGKDLSDHRPQSVTFGYTVDAVGPMNVDPANWMANLPALSDLSLTELPIPGTHDSGSYDITRRSPWALTGKKQFGFITDLPGFIQNLVVKPIAANWGRTQDNNLYDQLNSGIRYLDLRLTNEPDGQIYFEHGLRAEPASVGVADIGAFANAHPKELVVVYVQEITNFSPETHAKFIAEMETAFGSRMAPRSVGTSATLRDLWTMDKNVVVVYNDAQAVAADENLWPDDTLYRPYVGVQSAPALLVRNEGNLATRPQGTIWGMFGENTFNATSLVTGVLTLGPGSNEQMAASITNVAGYPWNLHSPVQQWIRSDFKSSVNLVTADWYQKYWPAGNTFVRDTIGAVYETLGSRLSPAAVTA